MKVTQQDINTLKKAYDELIGQRGTLEQEEGTANDLIDAGRKVIEKIERQLWNDEGWR